MLNSDQSLCAPQPFRVALADTCHVCASRHSHDNGLGRGRGARPVDVFLELGHLIGASIVTHGGAELSACIHGTASTLGLRYVHMRCCRYDKTALNPKRTTSNIRWVPRAAPSPRKSPKIHSLCGQVTFSNHSDVGAARRRAARNVYCCARSYSRREPELTCHSYQHDAARQ